MDFFLSYNHRDERWAEWIGWQLEVAGYKVRIQAWDFRPGGNFVVEMQRASTESERTIGVLSPNYLAAEFTQPEWAAAFAADPTGVDRKLLLVRVEPCNPTGLLAQIVQIRLDGLNEEVAVKRLLDGVTLKRSKPDSAPPFPAASKHDDVSRPSFPGGTPSVWNVPFPPNPFFTGRSELLDQLHKTIECGSIAAVVQPTAIHGLGGVGKTQLVAQYAWVHRGDYDAVMWVTADSATSVVSNFGGLIGPDALNLPEANETKQENRIAAIKAWLRTHRRWLLVFDTADSKEAIEAIRSLVPTDVTGRVIITSRLADWPLGFDTVVVDILPEPDAAAFLIRRTTKCDFKAGAFDDAVKVAQRLGCLPLALEQAAAYILRHRISLVAYENLLESAMGRLLAYSSQGGTIYQKSVATTWQVTLEKLGGVARAILRLASFLAPERVPRALFLAGGDIITASVAHARNGEPPGHLIVTEIDIEAALGELAEYSLIQLQPTEVSCHRLLQAVELESLEPNEREFWNERAVDIVAKFAPDDPSDLNQQTLSHTLFPHVNRVLQLAKGSLLEQRISLLKVWCGMYYFGRGEFAEAETELKAALDAVCLEQPLPLEKIAAIKHQLGLVMHSVDRLPEAEDYLRDALKLSEQLYGKESARSAATAVSLAVCVVISGRVEEGEVSISRALSMVEKEHGVASPRLCLLLVNLADAKERKGHYDEAERLLKRALDLLSKDESKNDERILILGELGLLLIRMFRFEDAEPHLRRALELAERIYGKTNYWYSRALNNLALVLHELQRYDAAEQMLLESIDLDEKIFGANHGFVATGLNNLGRTYRETNRPKQAEGFHARAIKIYEANYGRYDPRIAVAFTGLAFCLSDQRRFPEAENAFRKTLEIDEQVYGRNHPELAGDTANLAGVLMEMEKYALADPLLRRSLRIAESSFGKDHRVTRGTRAMFEELQRRKKMFRPSR